MDNDVAHSLANNSNEDDLIQQLLEEAHARLQSSSSLAENSLASIADADAISHNVPRLASPCGWVLMYYLLTLYEGYLHCLQQLV
jgi:hypothetical protein